MVQELPQQCVNECKTSFCRACGKSSLSPVLSLGSTPLANALLKEDQLGNPEAQWPLDLVRCEACSLVQITATVPSESMFSDYAYFSSFSDTMVEHAKSIATKLTEARSLAADSLVIEVASNDGYLLQWYQKAGVPVLGIEPAQNIAKVAIEERKIPTIAKFFGSEIAVELAESGKQADIIHANNVLAHVPDLNGVVKGFEALLKPSGRVVVEAPYVGDLLRHAEFDTIYHEHLCYFSLTALDQLFRSHGLTIVEVERLEIHGGSLRLHACHSGCEPVGQCVTNLLAEEADWVFCESHYQAFSKRVEQLRESLLKKLNELKAEGCRIAVYGASAKGSTLMNYFGVDNRLVDYVVDRSTVKQGHYTPGTKLKIHSPDYLAKDKPDYCLLLTWNFAKEIMQQQARYRDEGGKFIIPIPEVCIA